MASITERRDQPQSLRHLDADEVEQLFEILQRRAPSTRLNSVRRSAEELKQRNSSFLVVLFRRNQKRTRDLRQEEPGLLARLRALKISSAGNSYGLNYFRVRTAITRLEQELATKNEKIVEQMREAFDVVDVLTERNEVHIMFSQETDLTLIDPYDIDNYK